MRAAVLAVVLATTLCASPARAADFPQEAYKPLWCAAMLALAADDYRGNTRFRDHVKKTASYEFGSELMATRARRMLVQAGLTPEQIAPHEAEAADAARAQLRDRTQAPAFTWMACWLDVEVELAALRASRDAPAR